MDRSNRCHQHCSVWHSDDETRVWSGRTRLRSDQEMQGLRLRFSALDNFRRDSKEHGMIRAIRTGGGADVPEHRLGPANTSEPRKG